MEPSVVQRRLVQFTRLCRFPQGVGTGRSPKGGKHTSRELRLGQMETPWTPEEIIRAMDDVIEGDQPLHRWDYLVSVEHRDPLANEWGAQCRDLEREFRVSGSHQLISDVGVEKLRHLRAELIARCQSLT